MQSQEHYQIQIIQNNGSIPEMQILLKFKTILSEQLPNINVTNIIKNLFDKIHYSIVFLKNFPKVQAIGGACFRVFDEVSTIILEYFAANHKFQGKGYGFKLMNELKNFAKNKGIKRIATHADINSVYFYQKCGFIMYNKTNDLWQAYLDDYKQSQLMVYQIQVDIDYDNLKSIVNQQYQNLLAYANEIEYRGIKFDQEELEILVDKEISKYYKSLGRKYVSKKSKQAIKKKLLQKKQSLISSKTIVEKLQQILIIEEVNKSQYAWIFSFSFSYIPPGLKQKVTKIITLEQIQEKVLADDYSTTIEMCGQVEKALANLKYLLPVNSLYITTLKKLTSDISPVIESVLNGTFDHQLYLSKHRQKLEIASPQSSNII